MPSTTQPHSPYVKHPPFYFQACSKVHRHTDALPLSPDHLHDPLCPALLSLLHHAPVADLEQRCPLRHPGSHPDRHHVVHLQLHGHRLPDRLPGQGHPAGSPQIDGMVAHSAARHCSVSLPDGLALPGPIVRERHRRGRMEELGSRSTHCRDTGWMDWMEKLHCCKSGPTGGFCTRTDRQNLTD